MIRARPGRCFFGGGRSFPGGLDDVGGRRRREERRVRIIRRHGQMPHVRAGRRDDHGEGHGNCPSFGTGSYAWGSWWDTTAYETEWQGFDQRDCDGFFFGCVGRRDDMPSRYEERRGGEHARASRGTLSRGTKLLATKHNRNHRKLDCRIPSILYKR